MTLSLYNLNMASDCNLYIFHIYCCEGNMRIMFIRSQKPSGTSYPVFNWCHLTVNGSKKYG